MTGIARGNATRGRSTARTLDTSAADLALQNSADAAGARLCPRGIPNYDVASIVPVGTRGAAARGSCFIPRGIFPAPLVPGGIGMG